MRKLTELIILSMIVTITACDSGKVADEKETAENPIGKFDYLVEHPF